MIIPKAKNAIEGSHDVFNYSLEIVKYFFQLLIEKIKKNDDASRIKSLRFNVVVFFFKKKTFTNSMLFIEIFKYIYVYIQ